MDDETHGNGRDPRLGFTEVALRRSGRPRESASLADNAPDAIARLSRRGRFLHVNRVAARFFGRESLDLVGGAIRDLGLPRSVAARFLGSVRRTVRSANEQSFDFSVDSGQDEKHLTVRIVPERDAAGGVDSVLAIVYDVTRRTDVERQRDALLAQAQTARTRAEAAARARDQFLAIVSHELRSPLNGIQSWSHVLQNQLSASDNVSPVAMRALEGIRAGIDQQVKLIEFLLDATLAMTGELSLQRNPVQLRGPIEQAVVAMRPSAIAKDIAVYVDMRLDDEMFAGDTTRIRQVFDQLLGNAIKFTPRGGSVWLSARDIDGNAVIVVRDSGRGLAKDYEQWLFEPFRQADNSSTRRADGLGIGLALARRLIQLQGGRIDAESAGPHLGATFTITLPLQGVPPAKDEAVQRSSGSVTGSRTSNELAGVFAIVIDDQVEAREALSMLLTQFGARVTLAGSSRTGMEAIDRGLRPDVVICDIAMPEEDGYGFVQRLRNYETERGFATSSRAMSPIPVIALSAFAEASRRKRTATADFDLYLDKPVNPQQLVATLVQLAGRA